jgi:hypothetical protein
LTVRLSGRYKHAPMRRSLHSILAPLAVFVGALIAYRRGGTSLMMWNDTFNDQALVNQCLHNDACTLVGVQTSIRGLFHAVAWLQLRTLADWVAVRGDGLVLAIQILNALAVMIVFQIAARTQSTLAGAVAALILVFAIGNLSVPLTGINNLSLLLFLGAVLTLACAAAVRLPGVVSIALASLVAAIMANVHVICIVMGVSVVAVALLARRRPVLLATTAALVFTSATLAIAAPSWQHNALILLQGSPGSQATAPATWPRTEIVSWGVLAVAAWPLSLIFGTPQWVRYRRNALAALAVVVPMLAVFLLAPLLGIHTDPKYLTPIRAACAVAAALPIGCLVQSLVEPLAPSAYRTIGSALPGVVAIVIAFGASLGIPRPERALTVTDLATVAQLLGERGWTERHVVRGFSTPERATALAGMLQLREHAETQDATADDRDTATLVILRDGGLPDPMPAQWRILRHSSGFATVLILGEAQLNWDAFDFCVPTSDGGAPRCDPVSWDGFNPRGGQAAALPHMPPAGVRWQGAFRLRMHLLPTAPDTRGAIFMPRGQVCGGRIASINGATADISADRRRATFVVPPEQTDAQVELEWNVGSAECDAWHYDGLPPFVVEGDAREVDQLEAMLRGQEAGEEGPL